MYCKYCSKPLDDDSKFCPNCGAPVKENGVNQKQAPVKNSNGIIKMYSDFWMQYIDFNGRTTRTVFWAVSGINLLIALVIYIIARANYNEWTGQTSPLMYLLLVFGLAVLCPQLALCCRRFNDVNKPKWSIFAALGLSLLVVPAFRSESIIVNFVVYGLFGLTIYNIYITCLNSKS